MQENIRNHIQDHPLYSLVYKVVSNPDKDRAVQSILWLSSGSVR